jgi:Putative Flp pilus-assembly TadE/G-like
MNKRLLHSNRPGQSIPLIALIIVVLFGMVGLAVDVGNTYGQQRSAVRATEAATLSGMSTLLQTNNDASTWTAIQNSLKSNGIEVAAYQSGVAQTSDNRLVKAQYLKSDGNPLCFIGSCSGGNLSQASYIQVNVDGFTNTYFARIVGRDTLPVHAQAFAGKCAPTTGVYPIAISSSYLDSDRFKAPSDPNELTHFGLYSDENYQEKYQRRIYESNMVGSAGGFGYVRWKDDPQSGSKQYTADGLTGDGNMDLGFDEADWPSGSPLGNAPTGYPVRPGALNGNDSDWIHANTGVMDGLEPQLQTLITNRTRMILPIIDGEAGGGANAEYHVQRLGAFILRGYGSTPSLGKWFDFVYVGDSSAIACNITNVVQTTNLGLTGTVLLRPRYTIPPLAHQPVQYTVVMDVSGSMTWNFVGEAKNGSSVVQCGSSTDPAREARRVACGSNTRWSPVSERRIYVAKTALQNFVDLIETYDAMQIIYFSGDHLGASTSIWQYGTPTGKQALKDAVLVAGATSSAPYDVSGGTPSATGLDQARQLIASSPNTSTDGRTFKKVVIFMTDGVANYFKDTRNPMSGQKQFDWINDSHDNPSCKNLAGNTEIPSCQIGMTNTNPSFERPITAMASVAREIKNLNDGNTVIYVIALAGVPATGLSTDVAQQSTFPFYSEAPNPGQVGQIFAAINQSVEDPTCVPAGGANWVGSIGNDRTITDPATRSGFGLPADTSIYGYVYLKDQYGGLLQTAPVTQQNGQLSYSFANVAPGTYKLEAFAGYKGEDSPTPISRIYSSILLPDLTHSTSRAFAVDASQTLNSVVPLAPLYLDLNGNVCP